MNLNSLKNQGLIVENINGLKTSFLAGCVIGDELYFSSWLENGFYKLELKTGICKILKKFVQEKEDSYLFSEAIHFQNFIWFIPAHNSENIVKINLENLDITYIALPENGKSISDKEGNQFLKFKCCYKEGKSEFWLAPIGYNMLLKVDMLTDKIKKWEAFGDGIEPRDGTINFIDACFIGDEIWFCPYDCKDLVIFHTLEENFELRKWNHANEEFNLIRNYKNWVIYFSRTRANSILLINSKTYEEKEILLNIKSKEDISIRYMVADVIGNYILVAPFLAHEFIAVDLETGDVQVDTSLHEYRLNMGWEVERYQSSFRYNSKIIYVSDISGTPLMIYDLQENIVSYINIRVNTEHYNKFFEELYAENPNKALEKLNKSIVIEKEIPLSYYASSLLQDIDGLILPTDKVGQDTDGRKIFFNIKEL